MIQIGQTVMVNFDDFLLALRVLWVHPDGTFDGEILWYEA